MLSVAAFSRVRRLLTRRAKAVPFTHFQRPGYPAVTSCRSKINEEKVNRIIAETQPHFSSSGALSLASLRPNAG
jgi:hypothetical protein